MSEEEKKVDTETTESKEESKDEKKTDDESKSDKKDSHVEKPDYKAITERAEKAEAGQKKAEDALAKDRYEASKQKREDEKDVDEEDEPLTRREFNETLDKREKKAKGQEITDIAKFMSKSPDEAEALEATYKSWTFPAHLSLEEKMQTVYLFVNKDVIVGENTELKRALKGRKGVSTDASSTHHKEKPSSSADRLPGDVKSEMTRLGYKHNDNEGRWERKLPNGTVLIRDPKTKKIRPL